MLQKELKARASSSRLELSTKVRSTGLAGGSLTLSTPDRACVAEPKPYRFPRRP
jgi:hypothetical protein